MAPQELDLEAIHAFTIELARKAGKMILEGSTKRTAGGASTGQPEIKKNRVDREQHSLCAWSYRWGSSW